MKAQHIDGKTPKKLRAEMCRDFADGKIEVLLNVDLFGEGYDLAAQAGKDVTIDCVIQARPTQSLSLHLQQVGRGLRKKSDGSKALLLDHAGNWMRHGLPDDERVWSLEGEKRTRKKRQSAEEAGSVRQCPTCYGVHEPAPKCPYCGHVYESAGRKIEEREGELQEINTSAVRRSHLASQGRARTPEQMRALGYSAARTAHIMAARAEKTALQNTLRGLLKEANETITEHEMKKMKPKALKSMIVEMKTKLNKNGHQLFLES